MTDQQWLTCREPTTMLEVLRGKASDRKLRLLVVASCRRIWRWLPVACQDVTTVLERYADGVATPAEYETAWRRADSESVAAESDSPDTLAYAIASTGLSNPPTIPSASSCLDTAATAKATAFAELIATEVEYDSTRDAVRFQEVLAQVDFIRDIFGNPFRPTAFSPEWQSLTAIMLAKQMYESCDFSAMPILADALQDAGCDNGDLLNHLRGDGPHHRGCSALDLVLGKS